jgi:hypothetical protein
MLPPDFLTRFIRVTRRKRMLCQRIYITYCVITDTILVASDIIEATWVYRILIRILILPFPIINQEVNVIVISASKSLPVGLLKAREQRCGSFEIPFTTHALG